MQNDLNDAKRSFSVSDNVDEVRNVAYKVEETLEVCSLMGIGRSSGETIDAFLRYSVQLI